MAKIYKGFFVAVTLMVLYNTGNVGCSADIMKDIAKAFEKGLEECKKELNLDESFMMELYRFWKEEYDKVTRVVGCTIICMSKKLDLLGGDSKMHHANAEEFAKKHGADEIMAKKIVELIHGCEKENVNEADDCQRVLEVAKCFRTRTNELNWTPNMQDVLGEVMVDM